MAFVMLFSLIPAQAGSPEDGVWIMDGVGATFAPSDPRFADQVALQQVRAPPAWDVWTGSVAARVCVIDTGVRATHEDLAGARYLGGRDFVNDDDDAADDHGHGTMMTGIAVASIDNAVGIAGVGNVGFLAAKALNAQGGGSFQDAADAIGWCAQQGPRTVIVLGFGSLSSSPIMEDAIDAAVDGGAIVVASVGASSAVAFPARLPNVIATTCTTAVETRCSASAVGPEVDVAAPGTSIVTTGATSDASYVVTNGTSWSAGFVGGALALAWSHNTSLTAAALTARLLASAQDLGVPGEDDELGCGELDVKGLIEGAPDGATCGIPLLSPPTGVTATTGPGAGELTVRWEPPTNEGASPVSGYRVDSAASCSGPFSFLAQAESAARSHVDQGLGDGTTRCYHVTALNAQGPSSASPAAWATTYVVPEPPRDLRAEPGVAFGSIKVRWSVPSEGGFATGFVVERRDPGGDLEEIARVARVGGYNEEGLDLAGIYAYRVRATNPAGDSAPSDVACSRPAPWTAEPAINGIECALVEIWPAVNGS